jgi:hypothetical protein
MILHNYFPKIYIEPIKIFVKKKIYSNNIITPDFDRVPDLVWYSPADNAEKAVQLNVPNDKNMTNRGVAEYLYSTPNFEKEYIIGQRLLNSLISVTNESLDIIGERLVTFKLKYDTMNGFLSIIGSRDISFDDDNLLTINRIVSGEGNFVISTGYIVRLFNPVERLYQFSVFFDK